MKYLSKGNVSVDGVLIERAKDGTVEIPDELAKFAAHLIETHGLTPAKALAGEDDEPPEHTTTGTIKRGSHRK